MRYEVKMPSLGADMESGKLMEWKIVPGAFVRKGQTIAIVETTKSAVEIESFREGRVIELLGKIGEIIPVGQIIASFDVEGPVAVEVTKERKKISPAARKLALEKHLALENIIGSGPQGEVTLKDVETFSGMAKDEMSVVNVRQAIAKAMIRSKSEIPHYYLKSQVSLDHLLSWLDDKNASLDPEKRIMVPAMLLRAIIKSLQKFPSLNGHYENGVFTSSESIHLGMAITLKKEGVLVPALLDAQNLGSHELNQSLQDLIHRTHHQELKNRELTEGTITVTNVGDLGSDEVFGIIFPPQVALIGLGRIRRVPVVDNTGLRPGFVVSITLSADHRVSDGLTGARFLSEVEKWLNDPHKLEE